MMEYTIYSKKMAFKLRELGFKLLRTGINKNFPQYNTYIFEDSADLRQAITELSNN